jgi:predicted amidohydrolase YtcJ/heat shock protein HslJ
MNQKKTDLMLNYNNYHTQKTMNKFLTMAVVILVLLMASCTKTDHKNTGIEMADAIYFGGDILTMEGNEPNYVEALAVKDGKIIFIGTKEEALKLQEKDKSKLIDLQGKTMLPGFLDAHSHYSNALLVANQCKLYAPPSGPGKDVPSIIAELKSFAAERSIPKGEMIMAYGYDDSAMPNGRLLNRDDLDAAFPDNPVRVDHVSMHGCVLNSLALKKYGISANTETPEGGVIVRKPGTKEPYGLIMETAFLPVAAMSEPMTAQQEIDYTIAGQMLFAENGITTAHEGATQVPQFETMKRASEAGANVIDVVAFPFVTDLDKILALQPLEQWTKYNNRFKLGGVKVTLDGSPQGRTAFFTKPYLTGGPGGEKNWRGEPTFPLEIAKEAIKKVYDLNLPMNVHCNGDASIDLFFEAYEYARNGDYSKEWNVTTIHTQFLRKDQIKKFVDYKIRPSFYTLHTYYFAEAHLANRGMEEAMYISPIRDAIDSGLTPTNHTDFVVAPLDQMMMLWSAVNRISRGGMEVGKDQCVTPYEGLKAMTEWVAYQYDEQDSKGTLKVGKLADLVILDKNPLKVNPMAIKEIKVLETIKEGTVIYPKATKTKQIKAKSFGKTVTWTAHTCDIGTINRAAHKLWTLQTLNGTEVKTAKLPTMKFEHGKVAVFGGINQLSASYALVNTSLKIGEVTSTKMAGDPKLMELENNFKKTLAAVDGFNLKDKNLELLVNGRVVATFRAD